MSITEEKKWNAGGCLLGVIIKPKLATNIMSYGKRLKALESIGEKHQGEIKIHLTFEQKYSTLRIIVKLFFHKSEYRKD